MEYDSPDAFFDGEWTPDTVERDWQPGVDDYEAPPFIPEIDNMQADPVVATYPDIEGGESE
jgi:hypothetical protein